MPEGAAYDTGKPLMPPRTPAPTTATMAGGTERTDQAHKPRVPGPKSGSVISWYYDKGFGFLAPDDGSLEVFCHANEVEPGQAPLKVGDIVNFVTAYNKQREKWEVLPGRL